MTNKSRKFNTKHVIFIFCLLVCMALSISSVCANDVDVINDTAISQDTVNDGEIAPDVDVDEISSTDDDDISLPDNGEVFSAAGSTVYFDASASSDGSGTKSSPYKYLYGSRLEYVKTAYFADGVYQLKTPLNVYYSSYGTTIIGQSAKNTIIQSTTTSTYDFSISKNANLKLNTITFEGFHIKNEANLEANGVIFKNNGNFLQYSKAGLNNVNHTYTYGYGGIIICDPPENAYTYLTLNNCQFISNSAPYGGVLATYKSQVKINNCYFYNCSSSKFGGAIYSMYSNFTILDTVFRMNNAKYGGIIYSDHDTIFMKNSEISNSNAYSFGGAIATNVSSIDINKCNFTDYSSTTDAGGAIYAVKGKLYVSDSIFKNGLADFGGAICTLKTEFITASSQFWNNYARYYGGTIYNMYGTVYIHSNDFYNSHAESTGGTIFNGLSNEFKLINNLFLNSTSMYGHTVYVDGDKENIEESGNYYAGLYSLVGIYRTTLNGKDFSLLSNILTFSVSNYGKYITPASNSNSQTNSNVNLKIYKDGSSSSVIYTPFDSSNKVMFDLTKYVSGFGDGELDICLIDEAGDIIYSGTLAIDAGKSYSKQTFLDLNFKDLMLNMQYGNVYDITFDNVVSLFNYNPVSASSLPSYYNSKDYGYVTPVKNQLEGGNCWAFSGIATLEACIKKATGITYDFSEENAKNLMAAYSLFGVILESNDGGNRDMFSAYLTSWFGPIYDEDDVYDDYSSLSVIFDSIFHVQNIYFIPDRKDTSDNNLIKKAIMDYGAVSISAPWDKGGHAVSLIGWDDEYCGYDHFNDKCSGAWIFKNSWGSSYDSGRYIYISYQHRIYNAYTFIFNNDVAYDDIYQYDYAGVSNYYYYNKDAVYYKNNFVSRGDGILSAFSTYFSESTDYVASIYLNDKLVLTQSGRSFGGYNTIPLTKEIQLSKGDKFTVQIKNCNKGVNKIPFCSFYRSNKISSDNGISFLSYDGKTWQDQYDSNRVACIKAFTRSKTLTEITISVNKFDAVKVNTEVNIIVNLPEYYWNGGFQSKLDGLVTFSINGQNYYAQAQNGHANLKVKFDKKGTYAFTAQYKTNKEISNIVKFNFDVVDTIQSKIEILAGDVSKYYGAYKLYSATITNNSNPLSGVSVKIAANGNTYTRTTDSEGKVSLNLDLPVGDYVVTTQYGGKSFSSKYHVLTTIAESDAKGPYLNSIVTASFLNTYGRALSNGEVVFKIGSTEFKTTTDAYGFAREKINLGVGNYTVTVINKATGEQKQCSLEISKADTDCLLTISQNGNVVTATVEITPNSAQGYVYISVGDEFFTANLVNGKASVSVKNMKAGDNTATAVYSGDENFKVSLDYKKFTVAERPNHLVVSDGFSYYGSNSTFMATVYDSDNNTVSGEKVKITVLNKTYTVASNSDGQAILLLNLPAGDYNFVVEYKGQYYSGTNTVFSTIATSDSITGEYLSTKITATFKNNYGWLLNNKEVTFKVDGKQYKATTNDKGVATAGIDLIPGTYVVTAVNPVSGQEKEIKVKITKAYPTITLSIDQNNKDVVISASLSHSSATGNIIFNVGLSKYTVAVKNGKASLEFKNLAEGKYPVYANYAGDANFFNGLSDTKTFTVSNDNIVIYVPDFAKYYGGSEKLMVKVTNNGAPVKHAFVTVNHTEFYLPKYGLTDENGIAYIDINYVNPGEYNITSTAKGCTFVSKLTIKSTIDAEDMICEYGNTQVKATFRNSDGSLLTNQQVSFNYYTDKVNATTNSKGVATALFENYGASQNYRSFSAKNPVTGETKKINVLTIKSTPTVTLTFTRDGKFTVTASLSDSRATGKITFIHEGTKYTRTVNNGKCELNFIAFKAGTHTFVANYTGDSNFNDALSNSVSFTVIANKYAISASDLTMYYGGSNKLSVKLTNNGNPVKGATIKFNGIDSVTNIITDSNGIATVGFDKNAPGTYTVNAAYGTKSVTSKVTIKSTIVASDLTYEYSSAVAKATFYNTDGSLLSKKQVTITLGGIDHKVTTDSKGVATLDMSNYAPRTYTINVKNPVNGETKSFKVTVTKATPKLIITETHKSDGTERLDIVVSSKKATGKIYVKVDNADEVYGTIKDGAGVYHDFSNYPSDYYDVVVRYGGDSNFNSVSESLVFTIDKKIDITADDVYMSYGVNKYMVVKLTDLNGKPLKNKVVRLFKDYDTDYDFDYYELKTDSNGKVKVNCNEFDVGDHTIEVEVAKADPFSFNVVVYKATPKLTAAKKTFKVGVKTKKYTITLKNNLNKAMKYVKVTLKIKGKTYTAKTNGNGKATFYIKNLNKRGTFTASLRYAGNSVYKSVSKSAKITVR